MATITNTVQTLINKINENQTGAAPLTAEETLLLTKAVQALGENQDFEQALIAVAEQHLNTAQTSMLNATMQMGTNINEATLDLNTSKQALDSAKTKLDETSSELTTEMKIISTVNSVLKSIRRQEDGQIGNTQLLTSLDPDTEVMEEATSTCPMQSVIFSDDGAVNIYSAPQGQTTGSPSAVLNSHNWYEIPSGSNFEKATFTRKNYMGGSTNTARTLSTQRYGYYPVCGEYPLALSTDANNVAFKMICADYAAAGQTAINFRGLGLFFDADYGVAVGHYNTSKLKDKYGRWSTYTSNRVNHYELTAFYNNTKNCLQVVQNLKVWELYSDGWKDPKIATFTSVSEAQAWVNSQSDLFLVALRSQGGSSVHAPLKYNSYFNKTDNNRQYGEYHTPVTGYIGTATSSNNDPINSINYSGSEYYTSQCGTDQRVNTPNGWRGSQSFLWETATKKLIPIFTEIVLDALDSGQLSANTLAGDNAWNKVRINAKAIRMDTEKVMGECNHLVMSKVSSTYYGIHNIDLPHYNPYANAWLFSHNQFRNSVWYYKLARLSYVHRNNGIKGEYK